MSSTEKLRVAILDDYQDVGLSSADWSPVQDRVSVDVYTDTATSEDDVVARLQPYPIVCAMRERTKFPAEVIDRLPNLKFIATTGPRNAAIDVAYANAKGIVVSGTSGKGNSTLEHIWALILATARYLVHEDANVKRNAQKWQTYIPLGLAGRTLGLVGVGKLGSMTAKIAKAFDMRVVGWSPNLTRERAAEAGVEFAQSKEVLFRQSDIVSVHMVLSDRTHHLIKESDLLLMKPTAFFINTSRGPLVDERALVKILQQHKISGAGLDVYEIEPLPSDHPLRSLDNVTLTPHTGYVSDSMYEAFWGDTVDNIVGFLEGKPKRVLTA
ncbi:D-isomer specific 2-hydroxyacid dehydrogenase [Heliocybe sulcata]|uniref:D-isomer specific 2-hydroxyacid dehydrogenase n=1 Tax=Heliocybe sulcata TaxID=5364 RepID=A0A5C3NGL9_9AGAM|nr:D-isomer specific 2-hydroxyacid dehydrogenase [Heliocybe sulcata]